MRFLLLALALSGCGMEIEKGGYYVRSISVDAAPGLISATITFDNKYLPEQGGGCFEVCAVASVEQ